MQVQSLLTFSLTVFMGFFAIMNPIANTPIFLGLVEGENKEGRMKIARNACVTAFLIVLTFVIAGKYIFDLFGITIPAFKITGGILVFFVGFEMLMSRKSRIHGNNAGDAPDNVAVSPLAIPILAGPGTIVTAMNFVAGAGYVRMAVVIAVFALMIALTYVAFSLAERIVRKVGPNLIAVVGKLMGLILAVMGTGMVVAGIKLAFGL